MVTGRSVLYSYPPLRTTNYDAYNTNGGMVPDIALSQGCRERISGVADITIIYIYSITIIYIYLFIYHYYCNPINCVYSHLMLQEPFEDASLR